MSSSMRACAISSWAIDDRAKSSSMYGTHPVHSPSRCPRMSSSSASAKSSEARGSLTRDRLPQLLHLFRHTLELGADTDVAVLFAVTAIGDAAHRLGVGDRVKIFALHDPALGAFAVPEVSLAREYERHLEVLCLDGAGMHERIIVRPAREHLEDFHLEEPLEPFC